MPLSTTLESNKSERIHICLQTEVKQLLERAANFEGKTVSHFILHSALSQAQKTIQAHESMRLNAKDSALFLHALQHPSTPNARLQTAFQAHDKQVRSQ